MTKTITSANSKFTISAEGLYAGVQVQGFASDTAFTVDPVQTAETRMGVDGNMSAGWTPHIVPQTIHLQADSDSVEVFDTIYQYTQSQSEILWLTAVIEIPATGQSYTLSKGVMQTYTPVAPHNRVQEPKQYVIHWGKITPAKI